MDSIPNGTPLTGKLSARNWPAQFGGRGSVKPALPTPINIPAAGKVGIALLFAIGHHGPGLPVPGRSAFYENAKGIVLVR